MASTQQQILAFEKIRNRGLKSKSQMNVLSVELAAPIMLTDTKSDGPKTPTVRLVAKALAGYDQTILWLGHMPEGSYHEIMFSAYIFKGDPFRLTLAPGQECGA